MSILFPVLPNCFPVCRLKELLSESTGNTADSEQKIVESRPKNANFSANSSRTAKLGMETGSVKTATVTTSKTKNFIFASASASHWPFGMMYLPIYGTEDIHCK